MGALVKKIYILHGWTTDITSWKPFLEELKKENITPVFLSIPGLTAPIDRPWTLDDYVEWLYREVHEDIKISLLGHSNGGRIALAFAEKYPDEVAQLFLIDSAGIMHNDTLSKLKRGIFKTAAKIGKSFTQSSTARNILYKVAQESDYRDAPPLQKETMKNLISVDLTQRLREIKTPTFIIWGENDQITPYTDALVLKNELPNSVLFPIKNARHSPQITNSQDVVKIIKEHIV